jgi:hypothetical protein
MHFSVISVSSCSDCEVRSMAIVPVLTVLAGLLLLCIGLLVLWLRLGVDSSDSERACRSATRDGGPLSWDMDLVALALATGRDLYSDPAETDPPDTHRIQAVSG